MNDCYCPLYEQVIGNGKTLAKGQEPRLYEALKFCWSFLKIYYVNLKGPNKSSLNLKPYPFIQNFFIITKVILKNTLLRGGKLAHEGFFLGTFLGLISGNLILQGLKF